MKNQHIGHSYNAFSKYASQNKSAILTADVIMSSWRNVDYVLSQVVGKRGFEELYRRSLQSTGLKYPWIKLASVEKKGPVDFSILHTILLTQSPVDFAAASDAMMEEFQGILADLIGFSVTERLLSPVIGKLFEITTIKGSSL